jgi:hypothetical protein
MIPPDDEIFEVEKRIAERRHRVEAVTRAAGRQALRALASPWALATAAALGFLVAGGVQRRHKPHAHVDPETKKAAKAGGIASIGMALATWIIKSQLGSPMQMAELVLSKVKTFKRQPAQPVRTSPRGDRAAATTRR